METFTSRRKEIELSRSILSECDGDLEAQVQSESDSSFYEFMRKILYVTIFSFTLFNYLLFYRHTVGGNTVLETQCQTLSIRREWRRLSDSQKIAYLEAVKCLSTRPSQIRSDQMRYDDFPYAHRYWGMSSHNSALFLPWHRQFLHIYQESLRAECNYTGPLTYWDWSLDWKDVTSSPVWDSDIGFGGDGNYECQKEITDTGSKLNLTIVKGGCVEEGPFADLEVKWAGPLWRPHHLRRGFDAYAMKPIIHSISPDSISALMKVHRYETFNKNLEEGPHNVIPGIINGDFSVLTAPNDPVFFLHHVQLDRLWWLWQSKDWTNRGFQYNGQSSANSKVVASLNDMIDMGELGPSVTVGQVINIPQSLLCYKY